MGIQEKISLKNQVVKRKLFDNNIKLMGEVVNVLRITTAQDPDFPDDETMTITSTGNIDIIIDIPEDIVSLYGTSGKYGSTATPDQNNYFLYDILPIKMYSKFTDNVKVDDIFIYKNYSAEGVVSPYVFRATRKNGVFSRVSTWQEFVIAFHNLDLTNDVKQLIDEYMANEDF